MIHQAQQPQSISGERAMAHNSIQRVDDSECFELGTVRGHFARCALEHAGDRECPRGPRRPCQVRSRTQKKARPDEGRALESWLRGQDLNLRPLGYEPNELPGCSTARLSFHSNRNRGIQSHSANDSLQKNKRALRLTQPWPPEPAPWYPDGPPTPPKPSGHCRLRGNPFSECGCSHRDASCSADPTHRRA